MPVSEMSRACPLRAQAPLIALLAGVLAVRPAAANPPPAPVSLEQYATTNNIAGRAGVQFVTLRCGSLYTFTAGMLQADDKAELADTHREVANRFIVRAISAGDDQGFILDQMKRMLAMYSERAKQSKANTGNVFDDPLLRSDLEFCKKASK